MKSKLHETGAPLAGEMSGHMFFSEGFFGFDDALFAAGRLLRYVASTGQHARRAGGLDPALLRDARDAARLPGGAQVRRSSRSCKREFAARYRVIDIDGVRVEFGDGWGLVRASNTQPVLVVRFEARTPERLEEIRSAVHGAAAPPGRGRGGRALK